MAVVNYMTSAFGSTMRIPFVEGGQNVLMYKRISFASQNLGAADVMVIAAIPALFWMQDIIVRVHTAEGGVATIDVGDYSDIGVTATDADGYLNDADVNAAAGTVYRAGSNAEDYMTETLNMYGKVYTAASYIGILANNAVDAAVLDIWIKGIQLRNQEND